LDREATGMDRGLLLRALLAAYPGSARVVRDRAGLVGFGFAKTSPDLTEIGPVVARDPHAADALLDELLALTPGPHEAAALGENPQALAALRDRGFAPTFRTAVMLRGPPPAWRPRMIHAAAGLEKG
ncbi:MAG TPA: hypothetical protein VHH36_05800, partial [Candidatus Thermoplasmatota archaeon]|nr:hypothetical protein [Candidatus Thermoplasmatota archaeon]